jgi:hypothetical protein
MPQDRAFSHNRRRSSQSPPRVSTSPRQDRYDRINRSPTHRSNHGATQHDDMGSRQVDLSVLSHPPVTASIGDGLRQDYVNDQQTDAGPSTNEWRRVPSTEQLLNRLPIIASHLPALFPVDERSSQSKLGTWLDASAERQKLPGHSQTLNLINQYITWSSSSFAVLHQPTLLLAVHRVFTAAHVGIYDVYLVNSKRACIALSADSSVRCHRVVDRV